MDARSVGHELGVAYVVEGQVRRLGERTEVDVQVLDAAEATQIWSDRIGLDTTQPKSGLDVVVARLGDGIYTNIVRTAMRRFAGPPAADAGPYELAMYGRSEWYRDNNTLRGAREARKWFDRALLIDPNFVPAILARWRTFKYELDFDANADREKILKEMDELTFLAISLDNAYASAWTARAETLLQERRWEAALEANANC